VRGLRGRRGAGLALLAVLVTLVAAWAVLGRLSPTIVPLPSGDPANGVTISNDIDSATVTIVYERPDGTTEKLADLPPGQHAVVDSIFAEREGLCRTGRLVALTAEGAELDELYLVCRGRSWTVRTP
jgi:hypothetical protein